MKKLKGFVRSNSIDKRFRGLPGLGFGVVLVTDSCYSLSFSLGLHFCFSSYIVHLQCTSEGRSLDVLRNLSFFLCVG